jgi:hypothetical protein
MYLSKKIAGQMFLLLAGMLLLAACSPATPASPTIDANMIYTAAAQTVQAQMTQEAALNPSPTATLEPTATEAIPTANTNLPTLPGVGTPGAGLPTQALPGVPTLTPMGAVPATAMPAASRGFQWVSNDPADDSVVEAGSKFDIAWTIKNAGTTTWTTSYTYSYFSGNKFFEKTRYNLKAEVKPGEEVTVLVDAVAPSKSGSYYTWWKLTNDQGQNIGDMDLRITVVKPGETAAPTATVTATPEE